MLAHLADVSIRSLLLALPAAIVLWILRNRRTAALQHAVWAAVVCGMLALFAFGQALPRLPLRILNRPAAVVPATPAAAVLDRLTPDGATSAGILAPVPAKPPRSVDWKNVVVYAYGAIALAFLARFVTGMFLVRKLLATAGPIAYAGVNRLYESKRIAVPFTVGWLRPRILLPLEWRDWDRAKLDAVLAHEGAHVRRHDGLVAALAGVNRCVFWFHPLAWMLERKLALLAEQACDEFCMAALGDRERYANLLLEMALVVDGSHGRLRRHALTMAAGSHLRQRIDSLLQEGRTFSRGLTWTGWAAVTVCGIPLVLAAGAVELVQAAVPQSPAAAAPKFDVASIKLCNPGDAGSRGGKSGGRGRGGGRGFGTTPGRLNLTCMSVRDMMLNAYVMPSVADPAPINSSISDPQAIRGGPAWVHSDSYTIEAKTDDPVANGPTGRTPAQLKMMGPMLRALLEDRFQLKIRREVEEVPMYALTVAKSGLKLKPMEEGGCTPFDPTKGVSASEIAPPDQKPVCGIHVGMNGPNWTLIALGALGNSIGALGQTVLDRPVVDKTGIAGIFNIRLEFARDETAPARFPQGLGPPPIEASDIPPGPSIFTELEQKLGLKLVPDKGPRGYIVIDRVERPSEN